MLRIKAEDFFDLSVRMGKMAELLKIPPSSTALVSEEVEEIVRTFLPDILGYCRSLELGASEKKAEKILRILNLAIRESHDDKKDKFTFTVQNLVLEIKELQSRIVDELSAVHLMQIPKYRAAFYEKPEDRWQPILVRFPDAIFDVEKASQCMAVGQYTASVFHLMRAMEVGLEELKIDLSIDVFSPTWEASLQKIEAKLSTTSVKKQSSIGRKRTAFMKDSVHYIRGIAHAWRNPTMHRIERTYDEYEALDVHNAVAAFMRYLVDNLKPKKTRSK